MLLFFSGKTEPSTAADPPMDKTTVFYIAVGVACGIILIMALAVAAIHVHSMPSPNKEGLVMYMYVMFESELAYYVLLRPLVQSTLLRSSSVKLQCSKLVIPDKIYSLPTVRHKYYF